MGGTPPLADPEPEKILVRGLNWLGDAVMSVPALQRLRERFPAAAISLLTPAKLKDLWSGQAFLNSAITLAEGENPWTVARRLRSSGFDAALILPNSPRSALEMWFARIPRRIGYAHPWRNWWLNPALPERPGHLPMRKHSVREIKQNLLPPSTPSAAPTTFPPTAHQLYDYLHLVAALGASAAPLAPNLELGAGAVAAAQSALVYKLAGRGPQPRSGESPLWLGLNPSAAYGPAKCWPVESFAAVARAVSRRVTNAAWLVFGASADLPLCQELARLAEGSAFCLAGQTTLAELMALLKLCRVLVTNDSGPMHLAAALGTPVVALFGSTSPELTRPGLPGDTRHRLLTAAVPCSPCFRRSCPIDHRCMTGITTERVIAAVLDLMPPASRSRQ
jgi:ADP-heptose:LPS heptosyltransferase